MEAILTQTHTNGDELIAYKVMEDKYIKFKYKQNGTTFPAMATRNFC
jgi:hypothetical protein